MSFKIPKSRDWTDVEHHIFLQVQTEFMGTQKKKLDMSLYKCYHIFKNPQKGY